MSKPVVKYATVCSGIEAPSVAVHNAGLNWKPVWFSEIEEFPSRVLAHHYPNVPNLGDMTKLHEREEYQQSAFNVLIGGTPCQSFSMAGLRRGLDDERGNLALEFIRILADKRPRFFVWENVPGVLSSNGGRDFAAILAGFTGKSIQPPKSGWRNAGIIEGIAAAYGVAWRVLDAKYFGVAQQRRRVFVVGFLGDWRTASAVLFEQGSLPGYPKPRKKTRQKDAGNAGSSAAFRYQNSQVGLVPATEAATVLSSSSGTDERSVPAYVVADARNAKVGHTVPTLQAVAGKETVNGTPLCFDAQQITSPTNSSNPSPDISPTLTALGLPTVIATGQANTEIVSDGDPSLTCNHEAPIVFGWQNSARQGLSASGEQSSTLDKSKVQALQSSGQIRRLTPVEFARLQGFPDGYCRIPLRKYPQKYVTKLRPADRWDGCTLMAADGPQYKAYGNSMAVPVVAWILKRIDHLLNIQA